MARDRDRFHLVMLAGTLGAVADTCERVAARRFSTYAERALAKQLLSLIDNYTEGRLPRLRVLYASMKPRSLAVVRPRPRKT